MTRFTFQGTGQTAGGGGKALLIVTGAVILFGWGAAAVLATAVVEALTAAVVVIVLAVFGLGALVVHRARHPNLVHVLPPVRELPAPERPAIEPPAPRELHQHVHFHVGAGANPKDVADVAEIIRRSQRPE